MPLQFGYSFGFVSQNWAFFQTSGHSAQEVKFWGSGLEREAGLETFWLIDQSKHQPSSTDDPAHGILTEVEGSVQFTSSLMQLVLLKGKIVFLIQKRRWSKLVSTRRPTVLSLPPPVRLPCSTLTLFLPLPPPPPIIFDQSLTTTSAIKLFLIRLGIYLFVNFVMSHLYDTKIA